MKIYIFWPFREFFFYENRFVLWKGLYLKKNRRVGVFEKNIYWKYQPLKRVLEKYICKNPQSIFLSFEKIFFWSFGEYFSFGKNYIFIKNQQVEQVLEKKNKSWKYRPLKRVPLQIYFQILTFINLLKKYFLGPIGPLKKKYFLVLRRIFCFTKIEWSFEKKNKIFFWKIHMDWSFEKNIFSKIHVF